ncbi:hypothetical protein ACH47X_19190 [Promicromonospora kroppenstedtii]|uniref:Uncharacterized protein n=1 Tax=Promicromonospora kroppenstedtii TaxID=440482 RepID=A0ABW7XND3_9MICO
MADLSDPGVEALLGEEIVSLAATTFVATFAGVRLGRERARNEVDKELRRRFGKPRGTDAHHAYDAVVLQIVLTWERAQVAARAHSGVLIMLPDGSRLLSSTNVADDLRALL